MSLQVSLTLPPLPSINFEEEHDQTDVCSQAIGYWTSINSNLEDVCKQVEFLKWSAERSILLSNAFFTSKYKNLIPKTLQIKLQTDRNQFVKKWETLTELSPKIQNCHTFLHSCVKYVDGNLKKPEVSDNASPTPSESPDLLTELFLISIKAKVTSEHYLKRIDDCRRKIVEFTWMLDSNGGKLLANYNLLVNAFSNYPPTLHEFKLVKKGISEEKEMEPGSPEELSPSPHQLDQIRLTVTSDSESEPNTVKTPLPKLVQEKPPKTTSNISDDPKIEDEKPQKQPLIQHALKPSRAVRRRRRKQKLERAKLNVLHNSR